jgi:hypothetical protein
MRVKLASMKLSMLMACIHAWEVRGKVRDYADAVWHARIMIYMAGTEAEILDCDDLRSLWSPVSERRRRCRTGGGREDAIRLMGVARQ